ncbi:hypothetical protein BGZ82_003184, partial [Podila clonocystis]
RKSRQQRTPVSMPCLMLSGKKNSRPRREQKKRRNESGTQSSKPTGWPNRKQRRKPRSLQPGKKQKGQLKKAKPGPWRMMTRWKARMVSWKAGKARTKRVRMEKARMTAMRMKKRKRKRKR